MSLESIIPLEMKINILKIQKFKKFDKNLKKKKNILENILVQPKDVVLVHVGKFDANKGRTFSGQI